MTAPTVSAAPARLLPVDLGRFSWNTIGRTAVWSDSVYRLHGYQPGTVTPPGALLLQHHHAEDLHDSVDALHAGMLEDRLIVHEYRLVDAQQQVRPVVMVARPVSDPTGRVRQLCALLLATDLDAAAAQEVTRSYGAAPLIPVLRDAFHVGEPTAHVLLAARRPLTAWRTAQQQAFALRHTAASTGGDLRRTLADSLFPLEHLTAKPIKPVEPVGLAA